MNIFVDTSALLALLDRDDISHTLAGRIWQRLIAEKHKLFTTNYVLVETAALLQSRIGVDAVQELQSAIAPLLEPIWIGKDLHDSSMQAVLLANLRQLSVVDCSSILVARQSGIVHFFAFDRHFTQRGFTCLTS